MSINRFPSLHVEIETVDNSQSGFGERWTICSGPMYIFAVVISDQDQAAKMRSQLRYCMALQEQVEQSALAQTQTQLAFRPRASSGAGRSSNVTDNCGDEHCRTYVEHQRILQLQEQACQRCPRSRSREDQQHAESVTKAESSSPPAATSPTRSSRALQKQPLAQVSEVDSVTPSREISPKSTFTHNSNEPSSASNQSSDIPALIQAKADMWDQAKVTLAKLGHFNVEELQEELCMEREQKQRAADQSYEMAAAHCVAIAELTEKLEKQMTGVDTTLESEYSACKAKLASVEASYERQHDRSKKAREQNSVLTKKHKEALRKIKELHDENAELRKENVRDWVIAAAKDSAGNSSKETSHETGQETSQEASDTTTTTETTASTTTTKSKRKPPSSRKHRNNRAGNAKADDSDNSSADESTPVPPKIPSQIRLEMASLGRRFRLERTAGRGVVIAETGSFKGKEKAVSVEDEVGTTVGKGKEKAVSVEDEDSTIMGKGMSNSD